MIKQKTKNNVTGAALTFIALLLVCTPAHAQYESFFGGESWEYATAFRPIFNKTRDYDPELISCLTITYSFSRSDTTTVDGQKYYNGTINAIGHYSVQLREDTVNGRLYSLIDSNEYLICDMSLEVGDTFILPIPTWNSMETMRMLADSVSFVNSKKVIHLSALSGNDAYWWWTFLNYNGAINISLRFMEGVGPSYGIVPPYQDGELLLCLTKDDTLYYMTHPDLGCWQELSSVPDYPDTYMTIYPTPTERQLFLFFSTEDEIHGTVHIRDILGRVCFHTQVSSYSASLDISNLSSGIYMLTFIDQYNRKITKKIIKR